MHCKHNVPRRDLCKPLLNIDTVSLSTWIGVYGVTPHQAYNEHLLEHIQ